MPRMPRRAFGPLIERAGQASGGGTVVAGELQPQITTVRAWLLPAVTLAQPEAQAMSNRLKLEPGTTALS